MKNNFTNFFNSAVALFSKSNHPTVNRRSTDCQRVRVYTATPLSLPLKYAAMLLLTLTLSIGNAWGASGDVLFTQDFGSATAVAYAANTARSYSTSSTLSGLVGDAANLFQGAQCTAKGSCGLGINTTSGANSFATAGKFQAYADNTSWKWALYTTRNFASTAPTAIKFEMDVTVKYIASGKQEIAVVVGSGFSVGTNAPEASKGFTGFNIISGSSASGKHCIGKVGGTTKLETTGYISNNSEAHITWVINNTGSSLTYKNPSNADETVADGTYDLWVGTTKVLNDQARATTASSTYTGTTMQNLYIGNAVSGKHEAIIDNVKVTDLTPGGETPTHSVTATTNNALYGSATAASGTVAEGSTTTITATPESGYRFVSWAVSGAGSTLTSTSTNPTTLTMGTADATVTATFEAIPSHSIVYTNTKEMDNSANPTSYYEGVGVASFTKLRHAVGYDFTGWSPSSISSSATTNQTIDAQWSANAVAEGSGSLTYALAFGSGTVTTSSITRVNGALYDATDVSVSHTSFDDNTNKNGCSGKLHTTSAKDDANYVELTFKVADGYTFTPTEVSVRANAVSTAKTLEVELKDNAATPNSKSVTGALAAGSTDGGLAVTLDFDASGEVALEGTVTAKIFVYGATNAWRLGTSIVISGTIAAEVVKYDLTFAPGTGASGSMSAEQYAAGAEVTLPACTFTAPTGKEFDAWVVAKTVGGASVTVTDGKFTMPAEAVTATATWRTPAAHYTITYDKGAYGTGSIAAGDKTEDVAFTLSAERFTREGYVQTGWAESDGGAKAYNLGGSYTANAAITLYPVWTALDTYTASFACSASAPAAWTFANNGWADNKATVAYVCKFVENSISTPLQDGKTTENDVAFAKNTGSIATYDLGIATTVANVAGTFRVGSSSAKTFTIDYLGADGSTVLHTITVNHPASSNWGADDVNEVAIVDNVRYIKVKGITSWVIMQSFSVKYIETRTKYNVSFAPGTGASGSMSPLQYIAGAEVTLPACTFTAPTGKEFDAWTSSDVTITDNKFTMPASNVTVTATWKDAVTRYTVAYYDGASKLGEEDVEAGENPADYASYQTKSGYVFVGWFNNSDLAPAHAVADISAEVINADANYYGKWALDLQVTKIVFSNGFEAFINNGAVAAYYMSGESAPTITSYEGTNLKATGGVTISGDKIVLTGTDDSEKELDLTLAAVTPMSSYDKQTFDGSEAYVKAGLAFDDGWRFRKNASDGRIAKGLTRIYLFVGGGADKVTFTSIVQARAVKIYVNNVETSVTSTAAAGSTFDVPLDPNDANNMIAIVSNQTSGDGGVSDMKLNEHIISSDASLSSLTVNGNAVDLASGNLVAGVMTYSYELPYGTVAVPTVAAVANNEFASLGAITQAASTSGTATFTVTAEDASTQAYAVKFHVSRAQTLVIYDGKTSDPMNSISNSGSLTPGLEWTITNASSTSASSASAVTFDGKSYTKYVNVFSSKTTSSDRYMTITIPNGYVAKFRLVGCGNGSNSRSLFISKEITSTVDESIAFVTTTTATLAGMTSNFQLPGTYYLCCNASIRLYELSVQLYPIDYSRETSPKMYGTICLPNGGYMVGATIFEVAHMTYENEKPYKVFFDEVLNGVMVAGMPYIFLPKEGATSLAVTYTDAAGVTAGNELNYNGLHGTLSLMDGEAIYGKYIFYNNSIFMSENEANWLNANRAYIVLSEVPDFVTPLAPGRKRVSMSVNGKNTPTELDQISQEPRANSQKLLINGQLFILRGDKLFDVTGRLVK